jgi:hypothetical protein
MVERVGRVRYGCHFDTVNQASLMGLGVDDGEGRMFIYGARGVKRELLIQIDRFGQYARVDRIGSDLGMRQWTISSG